MDQLGSASRENPHYQHRGGRAVLDLKLMIYLFQVFVHCARTAGENGGDVAIRQAAVPFESEYFSDGSHGQSPSGHSALLEKGVFRPPSPEGIAHSRADCLTPEAGARASPECLRVFERNHCAF